MVAADRGRHASASLELHSLLQSAIAAKAFNIVVSLGLLHGYPSRIEPDDWRWQTGGSEGSIAKAERPHFWSGIVSTVS
jgi:hypothetical protein